MYMTLQYVQNNWYFCALSGTRTHVTLVSNQACYPLHHQDSPCWQHSELMRCICIAVSFSPAGQIYSSFQCIMFSTNQLPFGFLLFKVFKMLQEDKQKLQNYFLRLLLIFVLILNSSYIVLVLCCKAFQPWFFIVGTTCTRKSDVKFHVGHFGETLPPTPTPTKKAVSENNRPLHGFRHHLGCGAIMAKITANV